VETFVIRVWKPAEPEPDGPQTLRGLVERVRDGERHPFESGPGLLALLENALSATEGERRHES
jgi:hypothetical protein